MTPHPPRTFQRTLFLAAVVLLLSSSACALFLDLSGREMLLAGSLSTIAFLTAVGLYVARRLRGQG